MLRLAFLLLVLSVDVVAAPTVIEVHSPVVSVSGILIEDVGIETLGGVFTPLLNSGCKVPCSITQVFSTADDRQSEIKLFLFRGKAKMAKANHSLGRYVVLGVPLAPRGMPQVAVTFSVVGNLITLTALDKKSNRTLEVKRLEF